MRQRKASPPYSVHVTTTPRELDLHRVEEVQATSPPASNSVAAAAAIIVDEGERLLEDR